MRRLPFWVAREERLDQIDTTSFISILPILFSLFLHIKMKRCVPYFKSWFEWKQKGIEWDIVWMYVDGGWIWLLIIIRLLLAGFKMSYPLSTRSSKKSKKTPDASSTAML